MLVFATSCGGESPIAMTETVGFKLLVGHTSIGIDLSIRLPETTAGATGQGNWHRDWTAKPFEVFVTVDPTQIWPTADQPCAGPPVPARGTAVVTWRKELDQGAIWICEIRDEMGKVERVWLERIVHNVSELIECQIKLGATPTEARRSAAEAICESLRVIGRSEFTREDGMGRTDTVSRDHK
ncbi:hypothetical protein BH11MYX3_BH11MYX3_19050 [soil metagenome]